MIYDEFFFLDALEEAVLKADGRTMSILKRTRSEPFSVDDSSVEDLPYKMPRYDADVGQIDIGGVKIKIEPEEYQFADQGYSGSVERTPNIAVVQPQTSSSTTTLTQATLPSSAPILESVLRSQPAAAPKQVRTKKPRRRPRLTERRRPRKWVVTSTKTTATSTKVVVESEEELEPQPSDEIVEDIWHVSLESKNGHHTMKFLVKWEGFPPSENTFEPYEHIAHVEVVKEFASRKFETLELRVQAMLKNLIRDQSVLIESYNSNEKLLNEKLTRFDPLLFKCQILALLYTQESENSIVPSTCPFMRKLRQDNVLYKFYVEREAKKAKTSPRPRRAAALAVKKFDTDSESSATTLPISETAKSGRDLRSLRTSCPIEPNPKQNGDLPYLNDDSNSTQPHVLTETEKIQFIEKVLGKSMATLDNPLDQVEAIEPVVRVAIKKRKRASKRRISKKDFRKIDGTCDHCGNTFTRKDNLETHIITMHSENPPIYKCKFCSYETKWRRSIKTHEMTHSSAVSCEICLKVVTNARALLSHKCDKTGAEPEAELIL